MIAGVLFDLDGTLLDTAPDLGLALNLLRAEHGLPPLAHDVIRPVASHGARGLIALGFAVGPDDERFAALRDRFLALYAVHLCEHSVLFPGMAEVLATLQHRGLPWGIVTNKPARFTDPLLAQLALQPAPTVVVSGDTVGVSKPDPKPMLHAAAGLGVTAAACLYVGDAERDIEAGRNAGMRTAIADWGYLGADDSPASWGADCRLGQPADVLALLG